MKKGEDMVRVGFLLIVVLLLQGLAAGGRADERPKPAGPKLSKIEQEVLDRTNAERTKAGLKALKVEAKLLRAAREHSANMAKQGKLEHKLDDKTPADRVKAAGYKFLALAENIAEGPPTGAEAVKGWMKSEGHRTNLLGADYVEIGIGMATDSQGRPYYTQVFGKPWPR
jgi:uncharacterized protein YkwD